MCYLLLRCGYWQCSKCVICCYGLVIGSAVSDLLIRFGYWQCGKCVICCYNYGLVIGSTVSVLSVVIITVWLLAAR